MVYGFLKTIQRLSKKQPEKIASNGVLVKLNLNSISPFFHICMQFYFVRESLEGIPSMIFASHTSGLEVNTFYRQ